MSGQGPKYTAMAAALASVAYQLQRTADVYGTINSQDANYRAMQQEVKAAVGMPEDPAPDTPPPAIVLQAMTETDVEGLVTSLLSRVEANGNSIVTALRAEIEESDVAVMAALAQTRDEVLAAATAAPAAAEPAAEETPQ